jgi:PLP dependent protein
MSTSTDDDNVVDIAANIGHVRQMMDDAIASCERESGSVRLVAVSKTKPLELLQAAYEVRFIIYRVRIIKYCIFTDLIAHQQWLIKT